MTNAIAAVYEGPNKISIREYPKPKIGEEDLLVEIEIAGVDGSDVHMYLGEMENYNKLAPVIMGDELIGIVSEIGDKAAEQRSLKVGDRVTVEASWPCNSNDCPACRRGQYFLCKDGSENKNLGWWSSKDEPVLMGSCATHLFVPPEALVYKVPEEMSLEAAITCISVLANGIRWVEHCNLKMGETIVILGPGPQGLMAGVAAKERGACTVITIGLKRDATRLEMAREFGSDYIFEFEDESLISKIKELNGGKLADVVIDTTGVPDAGLLALDIVKAGGIVDLIGVSSSKVLPVNPTTLLVKELTLISSLSHPNYVQPAINVGYNIWKSNKYPLEKLVTHKFSLEDTELSIKTAGNMIPGERPIKTVIMPKMNQN